jgi:4-hydroxybenzoate polyprenyltransferase
MPGNFGAAVRRPGCLGMTLVVIRDPGLLGFVGIALLTAIWFLVGPGGLPAYWIEQIGLDLGICWLSRRVARRAGDLNATRRFWRAMSIGGVCFASADT